MYIYTVGLTGENTVVEDIERNSSGVVGGGEESWMIVDSEVVLQPDDGGAGLRCGVD